MAEKNRKNLITSETIEINGKVYSLKSTIQLLLERAADDPCFWTQIDNKAQWKTTPLFKWPSFPKLYSGIATFIDNCEDIKTLNSITLDIGLFLSSPIAPNFYQLVWWDVKKHLGLILVRVSKRIKVISNWELSQTVWDKIAWIWEYTDQVLTWKWDQY